MVAAAATAMATAVGAGGGGGVRGWGAGRGGGGQRAAAKQPDLGCRRGTRGGRRCAGRRVVEEARGGNGAESPRRRRPCVADPAAERPRRSAARRVGPRPAGAAAAAVGVAPGVWRVWHTRNPPARVARARDCPLGRRAATLPLLYDCRTTPVRHVVGQPAGAACRRLSTGPQIWPTAAARAAIVPCHGSQGARHRCVNSASGGGASRYVQGSWLAYQPAAPHSVAVEAGAASRGRTNDIRRRPFLVHDLWKDVAENTYCRIFTVHVKYERTFSDHSNSKGRCINIRYTMCATQVHAPTASVIASVAPLEGRGRGELPASSAAGGAAVARGGRLRFLGAVPPVTPARRPWRSHTVERSRYRCGGGRGCACVGGGIGGRPSRPLCTARS
ncbi:hypothetical protein BU14_0077s0043 [Porphyra umbilicalis]|uniref:Uncharacterized protein n=1 Tax=Porphyra umbilicalis TaxID=2786 RepID=A0A1X6PFH5_PORUM|nr:hypothetical protein BU14_0077s0043 [Porphyra umbilicalis]|eukprot:OSX79423.1 hypothetical protein BU14_0077s0043 [Porphyra umbilicalis]